VTIESVVAAVLMSGLFLLVTTLGLQVNAGDETALLRHPGRLLRSLTAMLVVMPVVASLLAYTFNLEPAVKIALVALALSPVPPFLPPRNIKAGAEPSYAIGLLTMTSLVAIVYVPLALTLLEVVFDIPLKISIGGVVRPVATTVFLPLLLGLLVKRFAPAFAARAAAPAERVAMLLLVIGLIPLMLVALWRVIPLLGNGTLAAMVVFCVAGLGVGHWLGGDQPNDRMTLAMSTAARHPGVAMAIVTANYPNQALVLPAVLLYVLLAVVLSVPYMRLTARHRAAPTVQTPG
jgi:BASS family bile acid:Na+ symporter